MCHIKYVHNASCAVPNPDCFDPCDQDKPCEYHTFDFEYCATIQCQTFTDTQHVLNVVLGMGMFCSVAVIVTMTVTYRRRMRHYAVASASDSPAPGSSIIRYRGGANPSAQIQMQTVPSSMANPAFSWTSSSSSDAETMATGALDQGIAKITTTSL